MNESIDATPVAIVSQAPNVISNGNDFYVIYAMNNGSTNNLVSTEFDSTDQAWNISTLTYGSKFPKPIANAIVKTILVGQGSGTSCVVYQTSSNQLAVVTFGYMSVTLRTTYTAATGNISNFCLYTDNTYLYIITNENGLLKRLRLNNNLIDSVIQLNGNGGVSAPNSTANTPGTLTAQLDQNGLLHCVFESNAGVTEVYQTSATNWKSQTVVSGGSGYLGLDLFTSGSTLYLSIGASSGSIDILTSTGANPNNWGTAYMSATSTAKSRVGIGVNVLGIFLSYLDNTGVIQCLYQLNGGSWNVTPLTGANGFVPNAPSPTSGPAVGVYNNFCYHVAYVSGNQVYDVYWAFAWSGTQLYPSMPQTADSLTVKEATPEEMIP